MLLDGKIQLTQDFIPVTNKNRPGDSMNPIYITVHDTANSANGADAAMHAEYVKGPDAEAAMTSWHFTVDDKEIYQHLPTNEQGYHSGDGDGPGNTLSIGIEICQNADGDRAKAEANAIILIRYLMELHSIPISGVFPHKHWSGKDCPNILLSRWDSFISDLEVYGDKFSSDTPLYIFDGITETVEAVLTNGAPKACPYFEAPHFEELNGGITFEFSVPADHEDAQYVREENLVGFRDVDGYYQVFIIRELQEEHGDDGALLKRAICEHASRELLDEIVEDLRPQNKSAVFALDNVLSGTRWEVGAVNWLGLESTNFYYTTVLDSIYTICDVWSGEVRFRFEVAGNQIVGRYVDIFGARGHLTGRRFEYTKDVKSIVRTVDSYNVKTALYGRGKGEETEDGYGRRIDFAQIEWVKGVNGAPVDKPLGQEWVGDPDALAQFGRANGTRHRFGIFEDGEETDRDSLIWKTWLQLQKMKQPIVNYEIKIIDLEALTGYSHKKLRLGDTVFVIDREFTPELVVQARVISIKRFKDQPEKTEVVLGSFHRKITDETNKINIIQSKLDHKEGIWDSKISGVSPIQAEWLEGEMDAMKAQIRAGKGTVTIDGNGIFVEDAANNKAMKIVGGAFSIANEKDPVTGEYDWRTFGDGDGFLADQIVAGFMKFDRLQGGTLTLGGQDNGNGQFVVRDANNNIIADLDANLGGFQKLYVGQLSGDNVLLANYDTIVYVVDPVNGNDQYDGLTSNTAFKTLQKAIDLIPKLNFGRVEIYMTEEMNYEHDIIIEGFFGTGSILIDLGSGVINGMVWMRNNNQAEIRFQNGELNQVYGTQFFEDGTLSIQNSTFVFIKDLHVYSRFNVDYCIKAKASNVEIENCTLWDATTASVNAEFGARVDMTGNNYGKSRAGVRAIGTGIVALYGGSQPSGDSTKGGTNTEVAYGGQIVGAASGVDLGQYLQPPAPPQTQWFDQTATHSWNDKYFPNTNGWRNDNQDVYQGQAQDWNGQYGNHKGCIWFNMAGIRSTVNAKPVLSVRLRLKRRDRGGVTYGQLPAQLWTLKSTSSVVNVSEPVLGTNYGNVAYLAWGDEVWIDLPKAVLDDEGFCLYVPDSQSLDKYMVLEPTGTLAVTFE